MNCPKCDKQMEHQEAEDDVGVVGCYFCETCNETVEDHYEPEGDEVI